MSHETGSTSPSPSRRFGAATLLVALAGGLAAGAAGFYLLSRGGREHAAATAEAPAEAKKPNYQ